ncbi:dsRBD fold-containing protein [Catelliglobosispora koreensis]|uniref:dsRBD fold-containing protein n=1 Tax=Catelliglobosispora koreensis TaxID=129052 RepID=UPI00037E0764|nr:dsRBD fold-containing protein [Catelliglobosispora koreensis]
MTTPTHWLVDIEIMPEDVNRMTYALARLRDGREGHASAIEASGHARRNPADFPRPELGAELAATRAVTALARKMQAHAAEDLSVLATPPAHSSGW